MKEVTLELTDKCFNNCLHCSSMAGENKSTYLDFKTIKYMLEKHRPEYVNISGGEPLLHKDIIDIVKYIHNRGIKIKLYTSGFDLKFKEKLKKLHSYIDVIVFPYYSNDIEVFNEIVGNNEGYNYVNQGIHFALAYKMNVEIHIVPMTLNLESLSETIKYLLNMGINKVNILKLVNQGRVNENSFIIPNENVLKEKSLNLIGISNVKIGLPFTEGKCIAGIEKIVILCNGKEIPCESYKDGACKCERLVG